MSEAVSADDATPVTYPEHGAHALKQLRAATADICDVISLTAEEDFHNTTVSMMTGNAVIVDSATTAVEYDRTPAHIARGGLDHYHVTLCLERHLYLSIIKRYIAASLETPLTASDLCRRFEISRATLYRLFEDDGGLARYVREQRLNRALMLLISPASEGKRLIDLAVDLRFSSDSTVVRAFRRQFGVTPGEIRELFEEWVRETGAAPTLDNVFHKLTRRQALPLTSSYCHDG